MQRTVTAGMINDNRITKSALELWRYDKSCCPLTYNLLFQLEYNLLAGVNISIFACVFVFLTPLLNINR